MRPALPNTGGPPNNLLGQQLVVSGTQPQLGPGYTQVTQLAQGGQMGLGGMNVSGQAGLPPVQQRGRATHLPAWHSPQLPATIIHLPQGAQPPQQQQQLVRPTAVLHPHLHHQQQQDQQRYPTPPPLPQGQGGAGRQFPASNDSAAPAAVAYNNMSAVKPPSRSRWDQGSQQQEQPSQQAQRRNGRQQQQHQQQQQQQQSQQQRLQQPVQAGMSASGQQQVPSAGKGHEHVSVVELRQQPLALPATLIPNRLDRSSARTPPLPPVVRQAGAYPPQPSAAPPVAATSQGMVVFPGPPPMPFGAAAAVPYNLSGRHAAAAHGGMQQQQAVAGGEPGVMVPPVAQLLQSAVGDAQGLLTILYQLLGTAASSAGSNTAEDAIYAAQALLAALRSQGRQQQQAQAAGEHPGVQAFCQWLTRVAAKVPAQQQVVLLECLAAMAKTKLGAIPDSLVECIMTSLAEAGQLAQANTFLAAGGALARLGAVQGSLVAVQTLLSEPVLRKLLREDADNGCQLVLDVLIGLHIAGVVAPQKSQETASKALQDSLPRLSPLQLAALLACHSRLGLESYVKLVRKTGAEYLKRPVAKPSIELLLGVLSGLAAGGSVTIKELPAQLLTRLCDELQPLLSACTGQQLLQATKVLAQLGCFKGSSPKQQQLVDQLQQQIQQARLQPDVWLALPELTETLQVVSAVQHQPGLLGLIKDLQSMQETQQTAVQQAEPAAIIQLVAGLQMQGQLQAQDMQQLLQEQLLKAIRHLAERHGAAADGRQPGHASTQWSGRGNAGKSLLYRGPLGTLNVRELAALIQVIKSAHPWPDGAANAAASTAAGKTAIKLPQGAAEASALLQGVLESEVLLHKLVQLPPDAAATGAGAGAGGSTRPLSTGVAEQQQQAGSSGGETSGVAPPPPPPPPPPQPQALAAAAVPPPPPPATAAGISGGVTATDTALRAAAEDDAAAVAAAALVPVVFAAEDWEALAALMHLCIDWYPLQQLPQQLVQLVLEVIESQAAVGSVHSCSAGAAVDLLWGLAVAGSLMLELWDSLATPLDKPQVGLTQQQLQQVFEAYCLVVLRINGPTPHPVPAGQLAASGEAFWAAVMAPRAAERAQLHEALVAAGIARPGSQPVQPQDGHMALFDVVVPEAQQAWVLQGSRSAIITTATQLLLARYSCVQLQVPPAQLNSNRQQDPASWTQQLQQLSQIAQLLPRLVALVELHNDPAQQQRRQQQLLPDAASIAGLSKLVTYLTTSINQGMLPTALPPAQMGTLRQIADMYKGPIAAPAPRLPLFGSIRLHRMQQQDTAAAAAMEAAMAAAAAALAADEAQPRDQDKQSDDAETLGYDVNDMDAQDLFLHNRIWLSVDDPWWFCHRLLLEEPARPPGWAANKQLGLIQGAGTSGSPLEGPSAAEAARVAKAAAAAALVVRAKWDQEQAEAAAAEAAARTAAGGNDIHQNAGNDMLTVGELHRGRSPEPMPKRQRHWRESRSRSRSTSFDSALSSSTTTGGSGSEQQQSYGRPSRSSGSEEEEGAISTNDEEGQVSNGGEDVTHSNRDGGQDKSHGSRDAADWARRRQQEGSNAGYSVKVDRSSRAGDLAVPASFAARGASGTHKSRQQQQQQQRRGRPGRRRSSSRSSSSGRSPSPDRAWDHSRLRRGPAGGGSRSSSPNASGSSRSESPPCRQSFAYKSQTRSSKRQITQNKWDVSTTDVMAAAAAATAAAIGLGSNNQVKPQQQLVSKPAALGTVGGAVAAAAPWLGLFAGMPAAQAKLAKLLQSRLLLPSELHESGLTAALQLDEDHLLRALEELSAALHERAQKQQAKQQQDAATAADGSKAAKLQRRSTGEANGYLVAICRRLGASVQPKKAIAAAGAASAAMVPGYHGFGGLGMGGYIGWGGQVTGGHVATGGSNAGAVDPMAAAPAAPAGGYGYMLVNGMLVPVAHPAYAMGAGYGAPPAAAAATSVAQPTSARPWALGFTDGSGGGAAAAAAYGRQPAQGPPAAAAAAAASNRRAGGGAGSNGTMSQYWQALCSGLGADGEVFSDVEDDHEIGDKGVDGAPISTAGAVTAAVTAARAPVHPRAPGIKIDMASNASVGAVQAGVGVVAAAGQQQQVAAGCVEEGEMEEGEA